MENERDIENHGIDSFERYEYIENINSNIIEQTRPDSTRYENQFIECLILKWNETNQGMNGTEQTINDNYVDDQANRKWSMAFNCFTFSKRRQQPRWMNENWMCHSHGNYEPIVSNRRQRCLLQYYSTLLMSFSIRTLRDIIIVQCMPSNGMSMEKVLKLRKTQRNANETMFAKNILMQLSFHVITLSRFKC